MSAGILCSAVITSEVSKAVLYCPLRAEAFVGLHPRSKAAPQGLGSFCIILITILYISNGTK